MRKLATLLVLLLVLFSAGCGSNVKVDAQQATAGQQLKDLQEAYDKGIIDRQEYEKAKKRIVDGD